MANVITREDHNYKHFNRAMGIKIESKAHYEYEMKRRGMVSQEKADYLAQVAQNKANSAPKNEFSPEARAIIQAAKASKDKKGRVRLGDNTIDAMKKLGVAIGNPNTPRESIQGGFSV